MTFSIGKYFFFQRLIYGITMKGSEFAKMLTWIESIISNLINRVAKIISCEKIMHVLNSRENALLVH